MPGKNEISIEYQKAVSLMDLVIIEENHKLLDIAVNNIEESVLICENPEIELFQMRSDVFFLLPDYLNNPTDSKLIELKKDLKLYKDGYENLCQKLNDYIGNVSKSLMNLFTPSNNLRKEINQIIIQFEKNIENLCIPLISQQQGLDTIDTSNLSEIEKDDLNEDKLNIKYEIIEFKKESEKLNIQYHKLFNQINQAVQILCNTIKEIPLSITNLQDIIEEAISKYEEILENEFSDSNKNKNGYFHNLLIKIKESFELINNEMKKIIREINEKINNLDEEYKKRKDSFISLKYKSDQIIDILTVKSNSIKDDILKVRDKNNQIKIKLPEIKISELIIEKIYKPMEDSIDCVKKEIFLESEGIKEIRANIIPTIIYQTSLDILFIMDTTGSMEQYIEITKKKLIEIMDKIKFECNGIDINLGFIGYKDVKEILKNDYLIIDFTKDYKYVKEEISKIKVGGGDDTAEDIAWAFERALEKSWTNNARIAILVTDAPCHGKEFHDINLLDDYKEDVIYIEKMKNLVEKMALKDISLICIKLKEDTNIMYAKFKEIYQKHNNNCFFDIIPLNCPEKISGIISDNAVKVYKDKRINQNN